MLRTFLKQSLVVYLAVILLGSFDLAQKNRKMLSAGDHNRRALVEAKNSDSELELIDSYIELSKNVVKPMPGSAEKISSAAEEIAGLTKVIEANPRYSDAFLKRGKAYAKLKEYDKAINDFTEAIKRNPNDFYAFNNRGVACAKTGNFGRAVADFTRVLYIDSRQYSSLYNIGLSYINEGLIKQEETLFRIAVSALTSYIEKAPNDIKPYRLRAIAYRKLGKTTEAETDEKKAESLEAEINK